MLFLFFIPFSLWIEGFLCRVSGVHQTQYYKQRLYWCFLKAIFSSCLFWCTPETLQRKPSIQRLKGIKKEITLHSFKCSLYWKSFANAAPCHISTFLTIKTFVQFFNCYVTLRQSLTQKQNRVPENDTSCLKLQMWNMNLHQETAKWEGKVYLLSYRKCSYTFSLLPLWSEELVFSTKAPILRTVFFKIFGDSFLRLFHF